MPTPRTNPRRLLRTSFGVAARAAATICVIIFAQAAISFSGSRENSARQPAPQDAQQKPDAPAEAATNTAGYVGSKVCAQCHAPIAAKYLKTDMGRSMSEITPPLLEKIPNSASVTDDRLHRHFDVHVENGKLFQSENAIDADGKELFRETHPIDWIIGSGANGFGALLRRGEFIFEAPLSFYSKTQAWALSPGYEFGDYGFNRPILPGCIACHSGQPQAVLTGNGRFLDPPFHELAIGCENCHGPGAAHVREMQGEDSSEPGKTHSIVNPAKIEPWLADNICMSCHQTGDAMVLRPGKDYRDFKPGAPLDQTLAIFMVPPRRDSPQTDLLEHYFSMTLSKCYRCERRPPRLHLLPRSSHRTGESRMRLRTTARNASIATTKKVARYPSPSASEKPPPTTAPAAICQSAMCKRSRTPCSRIIASSRKRKNRIRMPRFT